MLTKTHRDNFREWLPVKLDGHLAEHIEELLASHDAADARIAQKDAEIAALKEQLRPGSPTERAPTEWAYEAVCAAANKKRARIAELEAMLAEAKLALEPFKDEAARWEAFGPTENSLPSLWIRHASGTWADPPGAEALFDIDDLRRAARAYGKLGE